VKYGTVTKKGADKDRKIEIKMRDRKENRGRK
jgi:hypothetical protein